MLLIMKQLINFLRIPKNTFKECGILLISPGASTLNFYKIIYEKLYLPLEIRALYFFFNLKKKISNNQVSSWLYIFFSRYY